MHVEIISNEGCLRFEPKNFITMIFFLPKAGVVSISCERQPIEGPRHISIKLRL